MEAMLVLKTYIMLKATIGHALCKRHSNIINRISI